MGRLPNFTEHSELKAASKYETDGGFVSDAAPRSKKAKCGKNGTSKDTLLRLLDVPRQETISRSYFGRSEFSGSVSFAILFQRPRLVFECSANCEDRHAGAGLIVVFVF